MSAVYDLCVVGAGMIGSAAARHASARPGVKVCLVGPSEPKVRSSKDGRDTYGAHYDEGRITRACDSDPVWATLAQKSIERYRDIEKKSGVTFYSEVGNLMAGTKNETFIENVKATAASQNVQVKTLNATDVRNTFPYLQMPDSCQGVLEAQNAGYISPRNLVQAQKIIASKQGCTLIDDVVNNVARIVLDGKYVMRVTTSKGETIYSNSVLLATGAYTSFRHLLPEGGPDQLLCPLTVALAEVAAPDAHRLRKMPPVIFSGLPHPNWEKTFPRYDDGGVSFYMLPPIKYPDGRFYVKLGHFHGTVARRLETAAELKRWYISGNKTLAESHAKFIQSMLKGVPIQSWKGDYCVVVETPTNRPYINSVHGQLSVAIGGNGYAAKSSDEIGRLGANVALGRDWDSSIAKHLLAFRPMPQSGPTRTKSML